MAESTSSLALAPGLTLSKEQVASLLPILSSLLAAAPQQQTSDQEQRYTIKDMFTKKPKNSRTTRAQNYLLTIVREAAKSATIWETAPMMRDVTAAQFAKFFSTAYILCPELKAARQLLRTRLSATLLNRRQFLRRVGRLSPAQRQSTSSNLFGSGQSENDSNQSEVNSTETASGEQDLHNGDVVSISKQEELVGRGLFLKMMSDDPGEMFAEVILKSAKITSVQTDLELPIVTSAGISLFRDLKIGDKFVWWVSGIKSVPPRAPRNTHHTNVLPREDLEDPAPVHSECEYERERRQRIEANQRMLDSLMKDVAPLEKTSAHGPAPRRRKTTTPKRLSTPSKTKVTVGDIVAVRCSKYKDRPLLGRVKELQERAVLLCWMMGSFSGKWREWTGKEEGKTIVYSDIIPHADILHTDIHFTSSMRLPAGVAADLKQKY